MCTPLGADGLHRLRCYRCLPSQTFLHNGAVDALDIVMENVQHKCGHGRRRYSVQSERSCQSCALHQVHRREDRTHSMNGEW